MAGLSLKIGFLGSNHICHTAVSKMTFNQIRTKYTMLLYHKQPSYTMVEYCTAFQQSLMLFLHFEVPLVKHSGRNDGRLVVVTSGAEIAAKVVT